MYEDFRQRQLFNSPIILTQKHVSCLVVPSYDDHVLFSYETGRILALRYHLGRRLLGGFLGEVHICGANNWKQDKTEGLLSPSENLGGWHFPIDMSPTRVEISLETNSIMTQKSDKTINEKIKN